MERVVFKPIHLMNASFTGNTGLWLDYHGFQKHGFVEYDPVSQNNSILWFQSRINSFGGVVNLKSVDKYNEICDLSQKRRVYYHFSDFLIPIENVKKLKKLHGLTKEINTNNIHVLHYCQNQDFLVNWWNSKAAILKLPRSNFHFLDLAVNYWIDPITPKDVENKDVLYIGNYRSGNRLDFLYNFENVHVYGKYPKDIVADRKFQSKFIFHDRIKQEETANLLNNSFAQLITYDEIGINARATSSRLLFTISSGCLPLIDYKLKYLVPEKFHHLLVEFQDEADDLLKMSSSDRISIIKELQEYYKNQDNIINFAKNLRDCL